MIDSDHAVIYVVVLLFAFLEHLEDEVAANGRVICITEMLVDALFQSLDTLAQFFGVMPVDKLLEYGA